MRRSPISLLRNLSAIQRRRKVLFPVYSMCSTLASNVIELPKKHCNTSSSRLDGEEISISEAKKLLRHVNVEELKRKLRMERNEVISYSDLLKICESMGVARSTDEAAAFPRVLDEAGLVLIFRDKVFLHPDKVVDLLARAVPLALTPEDDPMREELKMLLKKKEEIDTLAHRHVRRILWTGFGFFLLQGGIFFRLTFWEFSWDVMEPVAFFMSTTGLLLRYAYFIFTSKDPTYINLNQRLFLSRQRKLFRKLNFDIERLIELEKMCKSPLDHVRGVDVFHEH